MEATKVSTKKTLFEGFSLFAIIVLLVIVAFTSLNTNSSLLLVLIGFSPTLITIIACIIIYEERMHSRLIVWLLPFILGAVFFFVLTSQKFLSYSIKVGTLTAINIFLSIVYLAVFFLFFWAIDATGGQKPKKVQETVILEHKAKALRPSTFKEYVASIEDKSKAINFVIGRVYNKYHGGTKEMREKISLPSEWYNDFSQAFQDETIKDRKTAIVAVEKIQNRLMMLEKIEIDVFGAQTLSLKNLIRDKSGNDKILDVMIKNDKDPIESYYKGALEFCKELREKLNKN